MDMKCKFCGGGDLVETGGIFYCWNCDAKYVIENGELRLLKCKMCIGDLIDCGDHYECDLCGARYEKAVPKPASVVSAPAPKEEKAVPKPEAKPVQKPEKPAPEPEEPKEEEFSDWKEVFYKGYNAAYVVKTPEEANTAIEVLEKCYPKAVKLIQEIEDDTEYVEACNEICAKFFGAIKFLAYHSFTKSNSSEIFKIQAAVKKDIKTSQDMMENINLHTKALELINEDMKNNKVLHKRREKLATLSSEFLVSIFEISQDHVFVKMVAEKSVEIFTGSKKIDVKEHHCPGIMGVIYGCDEYMEVSQEELTEAYWKNHLEKYKKLYEEKAKLEKERDRIEQEEKRAIAEEKKKVEALKNELAEVKDRSYEIAKRINKLNFFQKKEKERLNKEHLELVITERNLENKVKYMSALEEKNTENIIAEYSKKDVDVLDRIFDIEEELEINHYPNEDDFVKIFNSEIKKAMEYSVKK